jgi:hypothetical protein
MAKKNRSKGFIVGLIIGIIVAAGALYYWDQYHRKSKFERDTEKIENKVKKLLE